MTLSLYIKTNSILKDIENYFVYLSFLIDNQFWLSFSFALVYSTLIPFFWFFGDLKFCDFSSGSLIDHKISSFINFDDLLNCFFQKTKLALCMGCMTISHYVNDYTYLICIHHLHYYDHHYIHRFVSCMFQWFLHNLRWHCRLYLKRRQSPKKYTAKKLSKNSKRIIKSYKTVSLPSTHICTLAYFLTFVATHFDKNTHFGKKNIQSALGLNRINALLSKLTTLKKKCS